MPGVAFPLVGRLGLTSPPSPVLCVPLCPVSGRFACRSRPSTLPAAVAFVVSLTGSWSGRSPHTTPGLLVARPPMPGTEQGDRWLSQVPELPPCMHAPLLDPGGVLVTRQSAPRTTAFRPLETVGFPLHPALRDILLSTTILIAGLNHAACLLFPPAPYSHHWACTWISLLTCWLGFDRVGLEPYRSHPLGNRNQFHEMCSHSQGFGLTLARPVQCSARVLARTTGLPLLLLAESRTRP